VRAAIADGSGAVTLTTVDDPAPRSTEVIVQVDSCGICGTDLHIIDGDYPAARTPIVPGHEIAGTIVARGQAARHLEEGVFVVVDPVVECGYCDQCRSGRTNLCVNWQGYGVTEPGGFAEFVRVRAVDVEPIPPSVPHEWATLVEPVSCALHAHPGRLSMWSTSARIDICVLKVLEPTGPPRQFRTLIIPTAGIWLSRPLDR